MPGAWRTNVAAVSFARSLAGEPRAGIIAPQTLDTPPTAPPSSADFATAVHGSAFWRTPRSWCESSGARVLADVIAETGAATRPNWTSALLEAILRRATVLGQNPTLLPEFPADWTGALPRPWMRLALWLTYHALEYPADWRVVELPQLLVMPRFGQALPGAMSSDRTHCTLGDNGAGLPGDPFRHVVEGAGFDLEGTPPRPTTDPTAGTAGTLAALVGLAGLIWWSQS